ncbi:hypothetical protein J3459_009690 [Metarhizium acridum]|nr:hypothetical protein J3459_009690 [Metarhizium acridum]
MALEFEAFLRRQVTWWLACILGHKRLDKTCLSMRPGMFKTSFFRSTEQTTTRHSNLGGAAEECHVLRTALAIHQSTNPVGVDHLTFAGNRASQGACFDLHPAIWNSGSGCCVWHTRPNSHNLAAKLVEGNKRKKREKRSLSRTYVRAQR